MTAVVIAPRVENPTADTEAVTATGWFTIRPSRAYVAGGQWVQPVWSAQQNFAGAAVTVQLDPLTDVPYELYVNIPDGKRGRFEFTEFRIVPSSGSPVAWETLVQVTGPGGGSVLTDVVDARLDALESGLGGVSGGASSLGAITGISADAKTLIATPNSYATMRSLLVAASESHTHGVTDLTATGTKNGTKFLRDDNTWQNTPTAGAPAWTDITGKPTTFAPTTPIAQASVTGLVALQAEVDGLTAPDWSAVANKPNVAVLDGSNQLPLANLPIYAVVRIGNGGATVPVRPAYPGPIDFWCSTEPPRTGTTAGGTAAAAPGDSWLQAST